VERNFSQWTYWRRRSDELPPPRPPDAEDVGGWIQGVRDRLGALVGPDPAPVDPRVELGDPVEEPYGRRRRVVFDSELHMSVPAWLLEPDASRATGAAVLVVHGHGSDKDGVCALNGATGPGDYGRQLAAAGFVVLAPDLRGFGERADLLALRPTGSGTEPEGLEERIVRHQADCGWDLVCAVVTGTTPLALNLWDLRRCLDVLGGVPDVDPDRIGAVGWSYGGTLTLLLAALDERVRAAVVSGFFSSWRAAHRVPWNLCGRQVLDGLLGSIEHSDVAALIAPRALLVESARSDPLFDCDEAVRSVERTRATYRLLGADPEDVVHDVVDGEHAWSGRAVPPFLAAHLGP
jgi:dienelactone hydrolase